MSFKRICIMAVFAVFSSLGVVDAQTKALGCIFSTNGFGISYEHSMETKSFMSVSLSLDTDDLMWERADYPGVSASFVWNIIFAEKVSAYGNRISFFAGPGLMTGYVTDLDRQGGFAFGLEGRIGVECRFRRPFILTASVSPVLGTHVTSRTGNLFLKLYKTGLIETIVPEIGIKYAF